MVVTLLGSDVWIRGKGRDVDHSRLVLVHAPEMSARTAVVPKARVRCILSYVRQIVARVRRAARWAMGCACMDRSYSMAELCSLSGIGVTCWISSRVSLSTLQTWVHWGQR